MAVESLDGLSRFSGIPLKRRVTQVEPPQRQLRIPRNDQAKIFRNAEVVLARDPVDFHPIEGRELYRRMQDVELAIDRYDYAVKRYAA